MILEADRNGCVREVLIIAAALSIQDPRERPVEAQQAADDKHRRFADPDSDFVTFLNLWEYLAEQQRELSSSAFRRLCRAEFLNYLRVREWQDLQGQLQRLAGDLEVTVSSSSAERARLHLSLLAGLLSQIGMKAEPARHRPGACRDAGTAAAGRVPRGPQRAVRHLPRLRPDQETAGLDRGRRAGGDVPAVGADGGAHRAGVGRAAGPAPGQAQLQRAALGEETGRGGRAGEGDPVRGAAGDRPQGPLRPHRPGGRARAVHQARAGGGRLADQPPVLRREPAAAGRGRGGRAPGPPPRPGGRRGRAVRVLRRADPGRGGLGPALRHLVEAGPPGRPRPAHVHGRRPAQRGRRRGQRRRLSRRLDLGDPRPAARAAFLCLRAGQRHRRGDRGHPAEPAQPGERGRVLLAGARAAHRARHRDDPLAAQGAAPRPGARARRGAGGRRPPRPAVRGPARRGRPRAALAARGERPARRLGPRQAAPAPADHRPGDRRGPRPGRGQGRGRAAARAQAAAAGRPVPGGGRDHPHGPDLVELRRAAQGLPGGHRGRLPGPGRRGRVGRRAPVRDRGRGPRGHVGGHQAAHPARRAVAGEVDRGQPAHPGQARAQPQPARRRRGHVRRLRQLRRGLPDVRGGRPGLGRRRLRAAVRRRQVPPARGDRRRGDPGRVGPPAGALGRGPPRRPAGRRRSRPPRPTCAGSCRGSSIPGS